MRVALAFAMVVVVGMPSLARAHIQLTYPTPRSADQKARVCGVAGSTRGANVTTLEAGSQITVRWNETINHPGHFRISFDADGQDFSIPPDPTSDTALTDPNVIADLLPDVAGGPASYTFTLPDIECTNCTLQLIQLMTDKLPYTTDPASNDLYFQCADLTLVRTTPGVDGAPAPPDGGIPDAASTPDADPGEDPGDDGDTAATDDGDNAANDGSAADVSGGCATTTGSSPWLLGLALGALLRRRGDHGKMPRSR